MSTVKPVNFPTIQTRVEQPRETEKSEKLSHRDVKKPRADATKPNEGTRADKSAEEVTLHTSQAKVLKLYHPNKVAVKKTAQLGQVIDIKV